LPSATALRRPSPTSFPPARAAGAARPFARIETFDTVEAAREAWAEIEGLAPASPYQGFDFARVWTETFGAAWGVAPLIVVARDDAGRVSALLPLGRVARGPLRLAVFLGGKDANFAMGLFRPDVAWPPGEVAALLDAAARASWPRVDAFLFCNQPLEWQGAPNPLAGLRRQPSPSDAYKTTLPHDFAIWRDAHASKDAQKKLRKKAKRLEAIGPLAHRRAADPDDADRILAAFHEQKSARMRALGIVDVYEPPEARAFLTRLARCGLSDGAPRLELHAFTAGDRIVSTFGALSAGDRLSGLFLSYDGDSEIARSSPGELMVQAVVRDAMARGLRTLDLGVGEARYKNDACEAIEELFDSAHAATPLGAVAAFAFLAKHRLKRRIKRSPRLLEATQRLRRALGR
jgi:CelD/BcsL family acetyltransferase involved in cellulose biosynthesis